MRRRLASCSSFRVACATVGSGGSWVVWLWHRFWWRRSSACTARTAIERGERPFETVAAFSAVPSDYVRTGSRNPAYRAVLPRAVHAERALFPGVVPIVLATIGIWPPVTATRAALAIAGLVAFDGSLGLHGVLYRALYAVFSPLHSVRVPARFGMFVVLTLAMLAGTGAARLMSRIPNMTTRVVAAGCLTIAFVVDVWPQNLRSTAGLAIASIHLRRVAEPVCVVRVSRASPGRSLLGEPALSVIFRCGTRIR